MNEHEESIEGILDLFHTRFTRAEVNIQFTELWESDMGQVWKEVKWNSDRQLV